MNNIIDINDIPDKLFFKIGEVCELVDVQAHVLRYWETEFPMLSPQKNKSGQRSYRRKDVETALKIKQLLYNEMFTIAGARKKLQSDGRDSVKPKLTANAKAASGSSEVQAPTLFDNQISEPQLSPTKQLVNSADLDVIKEVANQLIELRSSLRKPL